jgi:GT2 family glycosyltransferase
MTGSADLERQPRVRHNDFGTLRVPEIGQWEPRRSVSVVIPAYGSQEKLDLTLASLAGQTYPSHLLQVVVVDDGSRPPLRLPEIVPANVSLIQSLPGKWGRAHACHSGAAYAEGDVVHWLDADMVVFHEHVEANMRWHHVADYLVVLGYKRFVEFPAGRLGPQEVFDAVSTGSAEKLFDVESSRRHEWVEKIIDATDGLRASRVRTYRVHVGATASTPRALLEAAGGMDNSLVLGEDTDLGFRLAQQGAVFVPEPVARSWHLGASTVMRRRDEVTRHNEPSLSQRLPMRRDWRRWIGRRWLVPYIDVVVDARDSSYEDVRARVAGALASTLPDVRVTVVGPWSGLTAGRRAPLDDPMLDLRLSHEAFAHDARVTYVERQPGTSAPTPFRLTCPPGWVPTPDALPRLVELIEAESHGLVLLALSQGSELVVARFERTAAVARAIAVRDEADDLDDLVHEMFGTHWIDGTEWAFVPAGDPPTAISVAALQAQAQKWQRAAAHWQQEAERWEAEAARLKEKLQAPVGKKLTEAALRRLSRAR